MQKKIAFVLYILVYLVGIILSIYGYTSGQKNLLERGVYLIVFFTPPFLVLLFYKKDK